MRAIAILDTETGGLLPIDPLLEVAVCLWSVERRAVIEARSWLVRSETNAAVAVNGIPVPLLADAEPRADVIASVLDWCESADAIAAHNAPFDLAFLPELAGMPCIDTCADLEWPGVRLGASLSETALGVLDYAVKGHRALRDVLTLADCFERAAEVLDRHSGPHAFDEWLAKSLRPKALYEVADKRFDPARNEAAKAAGFRWDAAAKSWRRKLAREDASALPFAVREVSP